MGGKGGWKGEKEGNKEGREEDREEGKGKEKEKGKGRKLCPKFSMVINDNSCRLASLFNFEMY